MCMGNKNLLGPEQSCRPEIVVVSEIKEQSALRPADFYINTGIAEDIIDQIAGKGRIHDKLLMEFYPIAARTALYMTMTSTV